MPDSTPPKDRIKREAMRLFVAHGVDAVSMRDIADAVGLKAPSLYAHFRSREELITDLFRPSYAEYGQQLSQVVAANQGCIQQIRAMVRVICALHEQDKLLFNFLLLTQHASLGEVPADDRNPVEVICRCVAAGMQAGEIPGRDPNLIAGAIIGVVVQAATFHLYGRLPRGLAAYADEIAATCIRIVS